MWIEYSMTLYLCPPRWTRCKMMQHGCRRLTLERKLMTFTGVNMPSLLPGKVYSRLARLAGSSCWTLWKSSASSTWCETLCSGWMVSTCRLMPMTAPGECHFMFNFPVALNNVVIISVTIMYKLNLSLISVSQRCIFCRVGYCQSSGHQIRNWDQGRQLYCLYWDGKYSHQQ